MAEDPSLQGAGGEAGKVGHLLHLLLLLLLLLLCCRCLLGSCSLRLLLSLGWTKVSVLHHLVNVHAVVLTVSQTPTDEVLGIRGYCRLGREGWIRGFQDDVLFQDCRLALIVPERL